VNRNTDEYRLLIENLPDAFAYHRVIYDQRGEPDDYLFLKANIAFEAMTGLKRKDIIGRKVSEVVPGLKEDSFDWIGTYGRLALEGGTIRFENYSEPLQRYYEVTAYSDEKDHFVTVFRDITENKQREMELLSNQKRFSQAQLFANMGAWEYHLAEGKLYWSDECAELFGIKPGEFQGSFEAFLAFVHHEDREYVIQTNQPAVELKEGMPLHYEHRIVRKDGVVRWVREEAGPFTDEDGKIIKIVGMVIDITAQKDAETKLKTIQANLENLVEERTGELKEANLNLQREVEERKKIAETLLYNNNQLKVLFETSKAIAEHKKIAVLTQTIVNAVTKLTALKTAALYSLNDDLLNLEATHPPLPADFPEPLRLAPLANHPHISKAIANRQPVVLADSRTADLTAAEKEVCDMRQLRSLLYLPLINQGQAIGVLIIGTVETLHEFTEEEISISQTLAGTAALALAESQLSEAQQNHIAETEEKNRALEQAEKELQRFKTISDKAVFGQGIADINGNLVYVNKSFANIHGYEPEELIGQHFSIFHTQKQLEDVYQLFSKQLNDGKFDQQEVLHVDRNGSEFPMLMSSITLNDEQGNPQYFATSAVGITKLKQAEAGLARSLEIYRKGMEGIIFSMGTMMGKRDNYTAGHQVRVAHLAVAIAEELSLEEVRIEGLKLAAEVHDIGKIGIPAEILTKPGALSELEYKIMQTHPSSGYDILKNIDFPWPLAEIVAQHHEKIDGSGYPEGLRGDDILLEAKIICLADAVEAMASHRPYRPALGIDAALEEIERQRGTLFDENVVDACLRLFREKGYLLEQ
jgi:PAS domain S-box-containing protein/putative nucleotidyltransferase with HDIG domain